MILQEGFSRLWRGTNASLALAIPTVSVFYQLGPRFFYWRQLILLCDWYAGGNLLALLWHVEELSRGAYWRVCFQFESIFPFSCRICCSHAGMHYLLPNRTGTNPNAGIIFILNILSPAAVCIFVACWILELKWNASFASLCDAFVVSHFLWSLLLST